MLAGVVRVCNVSRDGERRHGTPIPGFTPKHRTVPRHRNTRITQHHPPDHIQHRPHAPRDTGPQDTSWGGTALCENATTDGAKTSKARTLTGATPTPSTVQLSKTMDVP